MYDIDDTPLLVCFRVKSMLFVPKFFKRKLNDNLELKIKRIKANHAYTDEEWNAWSLEKLSSIILTV